MSTQYTSVYVRCPFYRREARNVVKCEGIVDNSRLAMEFSSNIQKAEWKEMMCNEGYTECPLYKVIIAEQYPEEKG